MQVNLKYITGVLAVLAALAAAQWQQLGPYGGNIYTVSVSYSNDNVVYVSTANMPSRFAKTTDGGQTWVTTGGTTSNQTMGTAVDPTNHDQLYAGTAYYVYRSTNGGQTFTGTYLANSYVYDLVVNNLSPATVYASGAYYLNSKWHIAFFKSTNSGANWTSSVLHDSTSWAYDIAIDRINPNNVYVGGYTYVNGVYSPQVYKSTDGGATWTAFSGGGFPTTGSYIFSLGVHPTNPAIIYIGTYTDGIYRTTNGGLTWTKASTHLYNFAMTTTLANPNAAYVTGYYDVYKTTDAGASWVNVSTGFQGKTPYGLAASQTNAQKAYFGDNFGVFKTTNGGANWTGTNSNMNLGAIYSFTVAPSSAATIYTSFEEVGVYKTTDCGSSWTLLPTPVSCGNICAFAINNADPNLLFGLEGTG